ncbi:MAG: DUF1634 domain-containing protein [Actinobacteria bacterium]|nr:DUF1634 domain-containing protein [Actinomycetota bacterium]MCL6095571.1 DUF1634 domain-containing protein [Actinomycetota bacterium]
MSEDHPVSSQDHLSSVPRSSKPTATTPLSSGGIDPEYIDPKGSKVAAAIVPDKPSHPDKSFVVDDEKVRKVEILISLVLRVGVVLSVLVITAGLVVTFIHHPAYAALSGHASYHSLTSMASKFPHTPGGLVKSLSAGQGQGIIVLGLVLLILTPVMRVAVSILTFVYQRDPLMTLVTCFVLSALIGSFFLGSA